MNTKDILAKAKQKKFLGEGDFAVRSFIDAKVQAMVQTILAEITPEIVKEAKKKVNEEIDGLTKRIMKGDKGEKGDKGDSPSETELESLIFPLIPDPIKGERGERGLVGPKGDSIIGPKGEDGKDGSPDTPIQIADKLNTKEEIVEIKVIKGLQNWLNTLKQNIREKTVQKSGGGQGNWVTEPPSGAINDSNTTFTLSSNVASNGKALILLYQGQVLEPGNQFTISGRTITTTFIPETGTSLFAFYTRT